MNRLMKWLKQESRWLGLILIIEFFILISVPHITHKSVVIYPTKALTQAKQESQDWQDSYKELALNYKKIARGICYKTEEEVKCLNKI